MKNQKNVEYSCKAPGILLDFLFYNEVSVADMADQIELTPEQFSGFIFGTKRISATQKNIIEKALEITPDKSALMFVESEK